MSQIERLRPSPTLALNELSAQLAAGDRRVHRFGFGQSPFPPPDNVVEALRENAWRRDYLTVQGLPELRERVAAFHSERHGHDFGADDVLVGPGSKQLIFLLQLVYGGELLLPSPSWVSYEPQARMLGLPVAWLPASSADRWRLSPDVLEHYCAKRSSARRMLILNYPNNPTGSRSKSRYYRRWRRYPESTGCWSSPMRFTENCTTRAGTPPSHGSTRRGPSLRAA